MIIELVKSNEKVTAISIDTETFYLQDYNENSFSVEDADLNKIDFLISIISPTKINLLFGSEITVSSLNLKYCLYNELGEKTEGEKLFTLIETPVDPVDPVDPTDPTDPVDPVDPTDPTDPVDPVDPEPEPEGTGNTSINDDTGIKEIKMYISPNVTKFIHRNLNADLTIINIKKFALENYDDFAEEDNIYSITKNELEFEFEKDFIYEISVENETVKLFSKYINGKPSAYFSSIKNLKAVSDKFALKLTGTVEENFELKLKIWSESKNALSYAGVNSVPVENNDIAILNKYVTYKIFAFLLTKNLIDSAYQTTLDDIENNVNTSASKLKLDVLEISDSSSSGSSDSGDSSDLFTKINSVLDDINAEIERLEFLIRKNFSLVSGKRKVYTNGLLR